jgi:hypothetical protein
MDGPRMERSDAGNEVTRRQNALAMAGTRHLLLGPMHTNGAEPLRRGWQQRASTSNSFEELAEALKGDVKRPGQSLIWGNKNLGVGLYLARLQHKQLQINDSADISQTVVERGTHLLIACEQGDELAQVIGSNLAFPWNASFTTFPALSKDSHDGWIEELYELGDGTNVTARFQDLADRARGHVALDCARYKNILFITAGFPWGIAFPGVPNTHMRRYPDFGRAAIAGLWASQPRQQSARTALLIDPQLVEGSEMPAISEALLRNGTLVRHARGKQAHSALVQTLLDVLPNDIVVLSSHSGDAPGVRVTYEYPDADKRVRRLVVDHARSFAKELGSELIEVREFHRFHSIDGVDWCDQAGKDALPMGSAATTWLEMGGAQQRNQFATSHEIIPRVKGSMGILLDDGVWIFASHGMHPATAPVVLNNSCWSWHRLCAKFTFAGARAYIGSLFPVTNIEAQEVAIAAFTKHSDRELYRALWLAQKEVYGDQGRRPYVMYGLPVVAIRPNHADSISFMHAAYAEAITAWDERSRNSPHQEVRHNAGRFVSFLREDYESFKRASTELLRERTLAVRLKRKADRFD